MRTMAQLTFRTPLAVALLVLLAAGVAGAQTNSENFARLKFNFNNPGARASGLGGAFISIADDATAAESNPAGLTALVRPEVSFELKGLQYLRKVANFSHVGTPRSFALQDKEFKNSLLSPSFVTVVMPVRRFVLSAFRYELVNFRSDFYTRGTFVPPDTTGGYFFPVRSDLNLRITNYGIAAATKITPRLSLGISAGLSHASMTSSLSRFFTEVFSPQTLASVASINDAANSFFANAGVLYQPTEKFSVGAIFKWRPSFDLQHEFRITSFPRDTTIRQTVTFGIPHSIGLGVAYRPTDLLTLSFDAVYLTYARLTDKFVLTFSENDATKDDFKVDNGVELHLGAEYVILIQNFGLVVRGGSYLEPDNSIRWVGVTNDKNDPSRTFARQALAALFAKGEAEIHATFGLGFLFSNNLQFDVAGNMSKSTREVVGSFVVRL
jgi:long-subunit fatty acid transport protein